MKNGLIALCFAVGVLFFGAAAHALPLRLNSPAPVLGNDLVVHIASKSQRAFGQRQCRKQYGSRLAFVTFRGNQFTCHFRKSNTALANGAARKCRKQGLRLNKVTSIRIKGNRSVTSYTCKR